MAIQVPLAYGVNPAAEAAGTQQVRKHVDTKDQVTPKLMAKALDPAKESERATATSERREKRRGHELDIRA